MSKFYGVTQFDYGHEYRWIFEEDVIKNNLGADFHLEDEMWKDVMFPMGGSQVSATSFELLETHTDAYAFLTKEGEGPDLEDPTLIDLAEYMVTVETDLESSTEIFLKQFNLTREDLMQVNKYAAFVDSVNKIKEMEEYRFNIETINVIDFDNPFYGDSKYITYSELLDIYEEFLEEKDTIDKEM